jgi:integrase
MKGIRQRGNSLLVDVTVHGVRRTGTVKGLNVNDAVALQAQMKADMLRDIIGNRQRKDTWTLRQAFEKTCELHWNPQESKSWDTLRANGELALSYFGEAAPVDTLDADRCDQFAKHLADSGLSGATVNRKMSALSKMLTVAVRKGKIQARPHIERKKEYQGRIRFLTPQEEKLVLSTFDQWGLDEQSEVACVLVDTGLRPSELWRMQSRDLDFLGNLIHVWESKNDKPRSIPMTTRVRDILWRRSDVVTGPLFPYDNFWFGRAWDRMKTHIGLASDGEFVPYALRHTCASRLVQRGVPLKVVQEWMGHKAIQTTLRYAHLCPTNLQEAVKVLETV